MTKRDQEIKLRLTVQEKKQIEDKAKQNRRKTARFIRERMLADDTTLKTQIDEDRRLLIRTLQGLGNNINQIAKEMNSKKDGIAPNELSELVKLIKNQLNKCK